MFISLNNTFNNEIKNFVESILFFDECCIISRIGGTPQYDINQIYEKFQRIIFILPMTDVETYMNSLAIGASSMAKSSLSDWGGSITSIYIVLPDAYENLPSDTISASQITEILNSYDKKNATDNIWVWPIQTNVWQTRENNVEKLPYQIKYKRGI